MINQFSIKQSTKPDGYKCDADRALREGKNKMFSELQEFLKNNTKINPKVIEDMTFVAEKFPCNAIIIPTIIHMVRTPLWLFQIRSTVSWESKHKV